MMNGSTMEQTLINELINLMCKCGCESFVGNFQRDHTMLVPRNAWSEDDLSKAVDYVRYMNEYFGKEEAVAVITSLVSRFHITQQNVTVPLTPDEKVGLES